MSESKKYSMLKINGNPALYIIKALIDIPKYGVKKGDTGGIIEDEINLSQDGDGWIEEGSFVTGRSRVRNGYVSGSSSLLEDVELKNGSVDGSKLEGSILIDGDILIEKSEVYSTSSFSGEGVIKGSVIVSGSFYGKYNVAGSRIEAEDECLFAGESDLKNAIIDVHSVYIPHDVTMESVYIRTSHMESHQDFTFEHMDINIEHRIMVGADYGSTKGRSVIRGSENNKVTIQGEHFEIHNSNISGSPSITGTVVVKNSTISGMPTITMQYGRIVDSAVDECAAIKSTAMYTKEFKGKRIDADTVYDFDKI